MITAIMAPIAQPKYGRVSKRAKAKGDVGSVFMKAYGSGKSPHIPRKWRTFSVFGAVCRSLKNYGKNLNVFTMLSNTFTIGSLLNGLVCPA